MTIDDEHRKAILDALEEHRAILMKAWGRVMNPVNSKRPSSRYVDGLHQRTMLNENAIKAIKATDESEA